MSIIRAAKKAFEKYVADVKKATTPRAYNFKEDMMLWNFTQENTLREWECISDKDIHGHSVAQFEPNGEGKMHLALVWPILCICMAHTRTSYSTKTLYQLLVRVGPGVSLKAGKGWPTRCTAYIYIYVCKSSLN